MQKGKIICLNGVSSAGKTTLARALQERLSEPYYWMSEDTFMEMAPKKFVADGSDKNDTIWTQAYVNMYHVIKMYSEMGCNTVVDVVLDSDSFLHEIVEILHGNPVLFVHVTCPPEELSRREKVRGNREIGIAVAALPHLCPKDEIYDITVDTHLNTTEVCADKIISLLNNSDNFQAFYTLWKRQISL